MAEIQTRPYITVAEATELFGISKDTVRRPCETKKKFVILQKKIYMPEQQNTEYKSVWKDEYLKWICGVERKQ
ncbi:MAG: DeoR family transcriptional regulator [Prevotellaceae bacterium]|nr:DeoR family transcriptional regulator [Prevotellaceae bacterium]